MGLIILHSADMETSLSCDYVASSFLITFTLQGCCVTLVSRDKLKILFLYIKFHTN